MNFQMIPLTEELVSHVKEEMIDAHGNIIATVPSFETQILNSNIKIASGSTPWSKIGDNMLVLGLVVLLIFCRVKLFQQPR